MTYNRRDDLRHTLEQLTDLDPKPLETIVVLDGCTDGSREEIAADFLDVLIVENTRKQGSIPSRDTAFRMAKGDIIVSLDDDSHPLQKDFIARVSKLAEDHPEAGAFGFHEMREAWPERRVGTDNQEIGRYVSAYPNCAGAIRSVLYGKHIRYPRFFSHAYAEPDFCLQVYGHGYAVWHEPTITVLHHASPVERDMKKRHFLNARNELWSVILRCPLPHCLWVAPYRVFRQMLFATSQGWDWVRDEPSWWVSATSGIGRCLSYRRPIPWKTYWAWMTLSRRPALTCAEVLERFPSIRKRIDEKN